MATPGLSHWHNSAVVHASLVLCTFVNRAVLLTTPLYPSSVNWLVRWSLGMHCTIYRLSRLCVSLMAHFVLRRVSNLHTHVHSQVTSLSPSHVPHHNHLSITYHCNHLMSPPLSHPHPYLMSPPLSHHHHHSVSLITISCIHPLPTTGHLHCMPLPPSPSTPRMH